MLVGSEDVDPRHAHCDRRLADSTEWVDELACEDTIRYLEYPSDQAAFEECVSQCKPVMITGVMETGAWLAASRWQSTDDLVDVHGDLEFKLRPTVNTSLRNYVEYTLTNEVDYPFYLSARGDFKGQEALLEDFSVPSWFEHDVYDWLDLNGSFRYFVCGGARTGTNIHVDPLGTCAWNTLACGHKRWVLFPPGDSDGYRKTIGALNDYQDTPPAYWFLDVLPSLKARAKELGMIECIQRPGQTIFVPAGWWHIVLNLDFTVAVTRNHMLPSMVPRALADFDQSSPMFARMLREEMKKLCAERRRRIPDED